MDSAGLDGAEVSPEGGLAFYVNASNFTMKSYDYDAIS